MMIDVGAERQVIGVINERSSPPQTGVLWRESCRVPRLRELLTDPAECLVAMETTAHHWRNLFAWLAIEGFSVALIDPCQVEGYLRPRSLCKLAFGSSPMTYIQRPFT